MNPQDGAKLKSVYSIPQEHHYAKFHQGISYIKSVLPPQYILTCGMYYIHQPREINRNILLNSSLTLTSAISEKKGQLF